MRASYTKVMSILTNLLPILAPFLKDAKTHTLVLILGAVMAYLAYADVKKKHVFAVNKIEKNQSKINGLEKQNIEILSALGHIKDSMDGIKETVNKTDNRVWRIGTDLQALKRKVK